MVNLQYCVIDYIMLDKYNTMLLDNPTFTAKNEKKLVNPCNREVYELCSIAKITSVFYCFLEFAKIFLILLNGSLSLVKSMPNALPMLSEISER